MRYKRLGKTDMNVSVVTVGTWAIGGAGWGDVDRNDSIKAIRAMLDNGVNFIDTAPVYGRGYSEEVVGDAISGLKRDDFYIATKVGLTWQGEDDPIVRNNGRENIFREIDLSLKRLKTDYVDLYIVHWPDFKTDPAETMGALTDLVKAGKIRNIGVSNYDEQMILDAEKYGVVGAIQPPYSMVNRSAEKLMKFCKERDIGTMTYGSLGAGILTGAIRELPNWDPSDTRLNFYDYFKEPKFSKIQQLLKVMDKIAEAHNAPVAQVTVNWSTQNPIVDTALMGVRNPREADENCAATAWELSAEEIDTLNKAIDQYLGEA
ncbi:MULTISPECIES: aldo/keto reductase [unclassified Clostridium]|uniref:aldo/keto reductase n=1 Tax=unclassified Clostridium TaxID=2614128 RepID=UPI00110644E2|nr:MULTISPECIES: aldo/keto reductase [unclassified Clostridium]